MTKNRVGYPGRRWDWQKWDGPPQRQTEEQLIQHLNATWRTRPSTLLICPPAGFGDQPVAYMHPWKLAPSPPTLVQKQPFSPSPACLQRPAMKNLYK